MTTQYVIKTLLNENQLLNDVIKYINAYDVSNFTGSARYIAKSWELFLKERYNSNAVLTDEPATLKNDLENEKAQVDNYSLQNAVAKNYKEEWPKFLKCESDILDHLIEKCD
jgi:hypothetical protein